MNTEKPRSELVVKSNTLINAMVDLSLQANRFLAFVISRLDRDQEPKPGERVRQEIDVLSFAEAFEIDPRNAYREVEALADQLQRKIIQLEQDGRRIKIGLITKGEYLDGQGQVFLTYDEDLVPHLLGLKAHFTRYRIQDVYQFGSAHSWRIYELLRQYKEIGKREFDLDEFKRKVGLSGLYPRFANLKARVLNPATEEINSTSDIRVAWEQIKRGRIIAGLRFHIAPNEATKTPREKIREKAEKELSGKPCLAPGLAKLLREDYRLNPKQAKELADLAAGEQEREVQALLPKLRKRWENLPEPKRVALGGYVFKALKAHLTQGTLI